jgi:hypothetical protein
MGNDTMRCQLTGGFSAQRLCFRVKYHPSSLGLSGIARGLVGIVAVFKDLTGAF